MIDILIIEDETDKCDIIIETINEIHNSLGSKIQHACTIIEAKELLQNHYFDILIIDLVIPLRKGEKADPINCCQLIEDIEISPFLKAPQFIIGLTRHTELTDQYSNFFDERLLHLLNYEKSSLEWKSKLKKLIYHQVKQKEYFLSPSEFVFKYDAAFIAAIYNPEFEAILELSNDWKEIIHEDDPSIYWETTIIDNGKTKRIIAAYADQMGMVACSAICMKVLMKFRPQYIFLTGITAGIKKDNVNFGDILVADTCWDYNSGKILEFQISNEVDQVKIPTLKFEPEPKSIPIKSSVKNRLLKHINDKDILFKIKKEWKGEDFYHELKAFIGPLASGSQVVASHFKMNEIKTQNRKLIGIEMEAYSLYYVCSQIFESKITPIVIKSICDFGDQNKDDKYQKYAAYTSVQFAKSFLFEFL